VLIVLNICNVVTSLSAECPTTVSIVPSYGQFEVGDVLTIGANGYDPTYTWTGIAANGAVSVSHIGGSYTLEEEGDFDLTCTATVSELTCTDLASASVAGTAVGKMSTTILVTIL